MSQQPAGWYPDPYAAVQGTERWWDGAQWLAQTRDATQHLPAGGPSGAWQQPQQQGWQQPAQQSWQQPAQQAWAPTGGWDGGPELASWGRRLGAYLLDGIPFVILVFVLLGFTGYYDVIARGVQGDESALAEAEAMLAIGSPTALLVTVSSAIAQFLYNVGFHATTGQTIGKRLLGIRVVRADDPSRLPALGAASLRWLVQLGGQQLLNNVPVVSFLVGGFGIVDHLWPLWDARKQALHDKAARTLVVRVR